jgi:hypothetical protein
VRVWASWLNGYRQEGQPDREDQRRGGGSDHGAAASATGASAAADGVG